MKKLLLIGVVLLVGLGCGGYKAQRKPMSPEELKVADLAQQVEAQAEQLKSEKFQEMLSEFYDRASRFRNACLRFGANSLEARSAFDRLNYQAAQISTNLNAQTDAELYAQWEKIRTGPLLQIAETLGYRPEKTDQ